MALQPWAPRSGEDHLLQRYWDERVGRADPILTEVGVAGAKGPQQWRGTSTQRRLDGVRLLRSAIPPEIYDRIGTRRLLSALPAGSAVELIEVKQGLSEAVVGQGIVGRALFKAQYPRLTVERTIALVKVADPRMNDVCEREGIEIHAEIIPNAAKPGDEMTSRTASLFNDGWIDALEPWRARVGGLFLTGVPLGSAKISLLHVADGPHLLATFDTRARFLAATAGKRVSMIEIRTKLTRGIVGRIVAHAAMLTDEYGLRVTEKRILVGHTDAAIAWICDQLGIAVEIVAMDATGDDSDADD